MDKGMLKLFMEDISGTFNMLGKGKLTKQPFKSAIVNGKLNSKKYFLRLIKGSKSNESQNMVKSITEGKKPRSIKGGGNKELIEYINNLWMLISKLEDMYNNNNTNMSGGAGDDSVEEINTGELPEVNTRREVRQPYTTYKVNMNQKFAAIIFTLIFWGILIFSFYYVYLHIHDLMALTMTGASGLLKYANSIMVEVNKGDIDTCTKAENRLVDNDGYYMEDDIIFKKVELSWISTSKPLDEEVCMIRSAAWHGVVRMFKTASDTVKISSMLVIAGIATATGGVSTMILMKASNFILSLANRALLLSMACNLLFNNQIPAVDFMRVLAGQIIQVDNERRQLAQGIDAGVANVRHLTEPGDMAQIAMGALRKNKSKESKMKKKKKKPSRTKRRRASRTHRR